MGRRAGRIVVVLAMAAALLSCGGGGDGDDPSAATTSEATTSTTSGVDPDAPPPADLLANLYQRVDAGDWTLGEGLVASLEYLTADGSLDDIVAGGEVQTEEATGLVAAAREYTEETPDAEHADDVAALLDVVVPSPEILRALAGVDPQHGRSAQPEQDCADLWLTIRPGFEPPGNCLEVVTTTVGAMNVNLFYPKAGVDGLTRERFETKTIEGLQQAVATFGGLGRLPDYIDLAVTPVSKGAILMDAGRNKLEPCRRCTIAVYGGGAAASRRPVRAGNRGRDGALLHALHVRGPVDRARGPIGGMVGGGRRADARRGRRTRGRPTVHQQS